MSGRKKHDSNLVRLRPTLLSKYACSSFSPRENCKDYLLDGGDYHLFTDLLRASPVIAAFDEPIEFSYPSPFLCLSGKRGNVGSTRHFGLDQAAPGYGSCSEEFFFH